MGSYHPTLWRTCRALANERRLLCLKAIFAQPALSVGEVAAAANMPENQASINLRVLQARGLITVQRQSRWTRYLPIPDPLVEHAAAILDSMRTALFTRQHAEREIIATLKAFTHARRVAILCHLLRNPGATLEAMVAATHISHPAMWRHLKTLRTTGLVTESEERWCLSPDGDMPPLAQAILAALSLPHPQLTSHEM